MSIFLWVLGSIVLFLLGFFHFLGVISYLMGQRIGKILKEKNNVKL